MEAGKQNTWGNDNVMKQSPELEKWNLTILVEMAMREKVAYHKINYVGESCQLLCIIGIVLKTILGSFPLEKVVSRESISDWWKPIMVKDISEIDRVDYRFGKGRYSSTAKRLKEKLNKKKKPVWITRKTCNGRLAQ